MCANRWVGKGTLWLTNMRMVLTAVAADPATGLRAFELPLVYISRDTFSQPIFACNNLAGKAPHREQSR